ncbi:hypothetical protein GCM10010339_94100 [Streptomyces alanosinicus]|uniref:Error-prone DNA polymerase n=1 Tax=Streptomyces alanosinicus TaxID=68171 RepID=A0A918MGX3_9ACTN|nr:hypothetical protein GCM10010339_94100 [Streptomyces alanosinicus]
MIWHEQIIAILARMTGCDRAAGDVARRALADPDRLPKVEQWFRRAAGERGYAKDVLDEVWETVSSFGAYGFCRAHAVAFAVPALQSAYLKAHFPAFLYAGLLEHDPGMWPRRVIVADARRYGVPVLSVDVNHSRATTASNRPNKGGACASPSPRSRASTQPRPPASPPASPTPAGRIVPVPGGASEGRRVASGRRGKRTCAAAAAVLGIAGKTLLSVGH